MSADRLHWLQQWLPLPVRPGEPRAAAAVRFAQSLDACAASGTLVEGPGGVVCVRREPWDCERLGLEAGKLEHLAVADAEAGALLVERALQRAREQALVHLSCRLDSRDYPGAGALRRTGFDLVDLVVTLGLDLTSPPATAPAAVRRATAADADALAELSGRAFSTRGDSYNRYLNDAGLPPAAAREVYGHWARTSIAGPAADLTLLIEESGQLAGFLTLCLPADGVARVPLNAVDSRFRNRGLYRQLVLAALGEAGAAGARRIEITTQLQQAAIQRTW